LRFKARHALFDRYPKVNYLFCVANAGIASMAAPKLYPVTDDQETFDKARDHFLDAVELAALHEEKPESGIKWHELDFLLPYHDLIAAAGFLLFVACVASFSWRSALGVGGAGLMALGWLMGRNA